MVSGGSVRASVGPQPVPPVSQRRDPPGSFDGALSGNGSILGVLRLLACPRRLRNGLDSGRDELRRAHRARSHPRERPVRLRVLHLGGYDGAARGDYGILVADSAAFGGSSRGNDRIRNFRHAHHRATPSNRHGIRILAHPDRRVRIHHRHTRHESGRPES